MTSFRPVAVAFPPEEFPAAAAVVVPTAFTTLVAPAREAGGTGHVGSIAAVAESEEPPAAALGDNKGGWVGVVGGCKILLSFSNCALSFISDAIIADIACSWSWEPPSGGAGGGGSWGPP